MDKLNPCPWCGRKMKIMYVSADRMFHVRHLRDSLEDECLLEEYLIPVENAKNLVEATARWNQNRKEDGE